MEQTKQQNKGLRRFLWILPLLGLLALALAVWVVSERYTSQFLPGTKILGVGCGNRTVEQAAEELSRTVQSTEVSLGDASGIEIGRFPLSAFLPEERMEPLTQDAFARQRAGAKWYDWFMEEDRSFRDRPMAGLTDDDVGDVLEELRFAGEGRVAPQSAYVEITDTGYRVVDAVPGNLFNVAVCARALGEALRGVDDLSDGIPAVILDGVAVQPAVTAESESIRRLTDELDEYLDQTVTLDFENGNTCTLTSEQIRSVSDISLAGHMAICRPDREKIRALVEELVNDYASDGVFAKFLHASETRPYVYYRVGDTGWILDREELTDRIAAALDSREGGVFTPKYDCTWYWKAYYKGYRVGDTYIEISLDNQYMWCYLDGKLLLETPVVTGDMAKRNDTRRGCFKIYYKKADTILRGPTWNDHVDYWMAFDGQIGLHDSSWRDEYGEDIYLSDGSHGCVNTPLDAMKTIYETYHNGDFVIVY